MSTQLASKFLTAAGILPEALDDPSVRDIMLDSNGHLYKKVIGEGFISMGRMNSVEALAFLGTVAHSLGTVITKDNPILEGEIPIYGSRISAAIPPIVESPSFVIRKHDVRVFTFADCLDFGALTQEAVELLEEAIIARKNIVIAGGAGEGKTTLANAILDGISTITPDHRLLILEDTRELQFLGPYCTFMRTSPKCSLLKLSRLALRFRPDRLVIGEIRAGGLALAALKLFSTCTQGGLFTIHSNSGQETLFRLEELLAEVSRASLKSLIGRSVDLIVYLERGALAEAPQVREIIKVAGYSAIKKKYITKKVYSV